MALINLHLSDPFERAGSFAISRSPWRTQRRSFAPHNTHFQYPAARDQIARTANLAPSGTR
jgi:hypothetical protein